MNENDKKVTKNEGDEDLLTVKEKKDKLDKKLQYITKKADTLKANGDAIELNPDNPQHEEWYFKDIYKGQ
jgi:hypothetical protein